jgi:arylsulfatase A-like enzyme
MKRWATVAVGLICAVCCDVLAAERPNIIYIVADDLGYADIGAQGGSKDVKTPNIDAIATGGVRFTNGYVSCPVCSPTRAGLMTGRYQQRFGHEFNPGPNEAGNFGLPTDQVTLPQALKSAGYATAMVGKWHLGFKPEMHPVRRGFDEFFGFLAGAHGYNMVGAGKNALMRGEQPVDSTDYLTDAFGREAAAFVERQAAAQGQDRSRGGPKPYFLYLAFNAVHVPQEAPQKYLDRFADTTDPKRKMMLAMLSAMDDAVGQVLAAVAKHGQDKNTLVIFHSDNGGPTPGNGSRNDPLRGYKGQAYEGGIRVPFVMRWTGHLPAGKVFEHPVIALDNFPTILAAAGAPAPKDVKFDGVDLLPHLLGKSDAPPHQTLFWRYGRVWAVREGNLKLVHGGPSAPVELFDLSSDAGEKKDLTAEQPETVKRLQAAYDQWSGQLEQPRWQTAPRGKKADGAGGGAGRKAKKKNKAAGAAGAADAAGAS